MQFIRFYGSISHVFEPEIAAKNMECILFDIPSPEAVKLRSEILPASPAFSMQRGTLTRCEVIRYPDADNAKCMKAWNRVKSKK